MGDIQRGAVVTNPVLVSLKLAKSTGTAIVRDCLDQSGITIVNKKSGKVRADPGRQAVRHHGDGLPLPGRPMAGLQGRHQGGRLVLRRRTAARNGCSRAASSPSCWRPACSCRCRRRLTAAARSPTAPATARRRSSGARSAAATRVTRATAATRAIGVAVVAARHRLRLQGQRPSPVTSPALGYYNNSDNCYYRQEDPQPPASDPIGGAATRRPTARSTWSPATTAHRRGAAATSTRWRSSSRPGDAGPSPLQLAEEALAEILLSPPDIRHGSVRRTASAASSGCRSGCGTTSTRTSPTRGGHSPTRSPTATLTVNITAEGDSIAWNMGDGHTVTCPNPGTKYTAAAGASGVADLRLPVRRRRATGEGERQVHDHGHDDVARELGGRRPERRHRRDPRTSRTTVRINEAQVVVK